MSPDQHLRYFAEFYVAVMNSGGTTPHMLMATEAARRQETQREALWWAGCYAFVYNFPTAEVLRDRWRPGEWGEGELEAWLGAHWDGLAFRKERKAVRAPERLAACMRSYARYMEVLSERPWFAGGIPDPRQRYNAAFDDLCSNVKFMGRYIAIRWLEVVRRLHDPALAMPDLRPEDGYHPRKGLALIYPEYAADLMGGDDAATLGRVNAIVEQVREALAELYGIRTDYYTLQSLLCEYKQSALAKRQYPGKSIDTELSYFRRVFAHWGEEAQARSVIWDVRRKVFPSWALGEVNGWDGVRPELGTTLAEFGYTWSDGIFDFAATSDLAKPVLRPEAQPLLP